MTKLYSSLTELIGNTPLLELKKFSSEENLKTNVIAKLEYFNPAGSVKDRAAKYIITEAVKSGRLQAGGTIVEATSGNTGIGLSAIATSLGFKTIIVMPETMSVERRKLMIAYGAELVLTEGAKGMKGAIEKAQEIVANTENAILAGQFINQANVQAHLETTGPEIWRDTSGEIDIFVAGIGTGGTITGAGQYLKQMNPNIKIVAVEPTDSPVLTKGVSGAHKIQGIGAGFVPEILNTSIYDEVITVQNEDAFETARRLGKTEGVLVGISSGAALWAAKQLASREENANKRIVVLLPDTGERYLSTALFTEI